MYFSDTVEYGENKFTAADTFQELHGPRFHTKTNLQSSSDVALNLLVHRKFHQHFHFLSKLMQSFSFEVVSDCEMDKGSHGRFPYYTGD